MKTLIYLQKFYCFGRDENRFGNKCPAQELFGIPNHIMMCW